MAAVVTLQSVGFRYAPTEPWLFREINLSLYPGEFYCLVGRSGIGKSTLLRIIAGLIPPTEGVVSNGQKYPNSQLPAGVVFQDARLLPWRNVFGNVAFALDSLPLSKAERIRRAEDSLTQVGLLSLAKRYPHELSGGQQQRVALARALATGAKLLLLDEPFASLDETTKTEMAELLGLVCRRNNLTTLLVTHDMQDAELFQAHTLTLNYSLASDQTSAMNSALRFR